MEPIAIHKILTCIILFAAVINLYLTLLDSVKYIKHRIRLYVLMFTLLLIKLALYGAHNGL